MDKNSSSNTENIRQKQGKLWSKDFVLLTAVQTCDLLTYYLVTPLVTKYATLQGATLSSAGIIAGVFGLIAIIVRPLSGLLSDRFNPKKLILATVAASCVSLFGYAISQSLAVFMIFRIVHGFSYAVFGTVIAAFALSFIPEGRKSEGMSWFSLSYLLGAVCGPALGIWMADALGFTILFLLCGVLMLLCLIPVKIVSSPAGYSFDEGNLFGEQRKNGMEIFSNSDQMDSNCRLEDATEQKGAEVQRFAVEQKGAEEQRLGIELKDAEEYRLADEYRSAAEHRPDAEQKSTKSQEDIKDQKASPDQKSSKNQEASKDQKALMDQITVKEQKSLKLTDFISIKALPLMLVMVCFSFNWGVVSSYVVLTGEARNVSKISLFFVVNTITLCALRPPVGRLADRKGLSFVLYPALFFEALAMALLAGADKLWLFLITGALKALGQGTVHPAIQAQCVKLETEKRSGVAMSTFLLGTDVGWGLGPIVGGALCERFGYGVMYLSCVIMPIIAFFIYLISTKFQYKDSQ